jgi:hypothetical protein
MDFSTLFPGIADWVAGLPKTWPFSMWQDVYAPFGAVHLVGLALLGGCVILLNLRLMGAGLVDEQPATLERNLRPWLIVGFVLVFGTGLVIGALNSEKLYYSPAFFAKMVALLAAAIFTFGVTSSIARSEGRIGPITMISGGAAFLIWLASLGVFSTTEGVSPGVFHMVAAAFGIFFIYGGRKLFGLQTRVIAAILFAVLYGGVFVVYWVVGFNNYDQVFLDLSRWSMIVGSILLLGLYGYEFYAGRAEAASPVAKMIALFSVLAWVTVAAGGRWIGFS